MPDMSVSFGTVEVFEAIAPHPDHGHPVPWRVAADGSTPARDEHAQTEASRDREEPAAAIATERPAATGAA